MIIPQASIEPPEPNGVKPHFLIGQDTTGHWLAVETHRLGGGIFQSREKAIHFAEFETGHRADAYEISTMPLSLFS